LGYGGEPTYCPRCSNATANLQGLCRSCGENIFQCPNCKNINYGKFNSFICTECGFFKYGKVDIILSVQLSFGAQKIENEKDKMEIQRSLSETLASAMKYHETLKGCKHSLFSMIRAPAVKLSKKSGKLIDMHSTYTNMCVPDYKSLVKLLRNANSMKSELLQYANSIITDSYKLEPSNNCYGCSEIFLQIFLKFIELSAYNNFCCKLYNELPLKELLFTSIFPCSSPSIAKLLVKALASLSVNDSQYNEAVLKRLNTAVDAMKTVTSLDRMKIRDEVILCIELLIRIHSRLLFILIQSPNSDKRHEEILGKVNETLQKILKESFPIANYCVAEEIVQPLLKYVLEVLYLPVKFNIAKLLIEKENIYTGIIQQCLIYTESKRLRETTADLIKRLFEIMPGTMIPTFNSLIANLSETLAIPQESAESLLSVFKHLVKELNKKKLVEEFNKVKVVEKILSFADEEINKIKDNTKDKLFWIGYSLSCLLEIVPELIQKTALPNELIRFIILTYTKARKLISMGNNYVNKSITTLKKIFHEISLEDLNAKKEVITQCLKVMEENKYETGTKVMLYSETYRIITAGKPESSYSLVLQKAPSQMMFIPGGLDRNTYLLSEVGNTVKDLRKIICNNPRMRNTEQILEVVVGDNVLGLDLDLKLVYELVWWPYIQKLKAPDIKDIPSIGNAKNEELEPMKVVYRLIGIDGESVEQKIDKLEPPPSIENPEIRFAAATTFLDKLENTTGVNMIFEDVEKIDAKENGLVENIISLLDIFTKIKVCRKKIIELKGHDLLGKKAMDMLGEELSNRYLKILTDILSEESESQLDIKDNENVSKLLQRLKSDCEKCKSSTEASKSSAKTLTKALPYFAYGNADAMNTLVNYFKDSIKFESLNESKESKEKIEVTYNINRLIEIIEGIPSQLFILHEALLYSGTAQAIIDYIKKWIEDNKNLAGLQIALKLLTELVKHHEPTQELILSLIEPIRNISKKKNSSPFKALYKKFVEQIHKSAKSQELKKKLEELKQEESKNDEHEAIKFTEEEPVCIMCGKNYLTAPQDLLGIYVYEKVRSFIDKESALRITIYSHLNFIHEKCHHSELEKLDEWSKATVRNFNTKCNDCIPIPGGEISAESFKAAVKCFIERLELRVEGKSGYKLMICGIMTLLRKFAYEESLGIYTQNKGLIHNFQLIPFMMQLIFYLGMNNNYSFDELNKEVQAFFDEIPKFKDDLESIIEIELAANSKRKKHSLKVSTDDFLYVCTLALLFSNSDEWTNIKEKLLHSTIQVLAFGTVNNPTKLKCKKSLKKVPKAKDKSPNFIKELKPLLIFLIMIDQYKTQLKVFVKETAKTPEEYIRSLYEGIKNRGKCLKIGEEIANVYSKVITEAKNVDELLKLLNPSKEISQEFKKIKAITFEE